MKSIHQMIKNAEGSLPIAECLLHHLDDIIIKTDLERHSGKVASTHYKPSSMNCLRMMYYQRTGVPKDTNQIRKASDIGVAESGTDRHARIQGWLLKLNEGNSGWKYWDVEEYINKFKPKGITVKQKRGYETTCYNEIYNLSFSCDGILEYKGVFYVLEIKTENKYKSFQRKETDPHHIYQGTCYSVSFGINSVIYIYECRDNCERKGYEVKIDATKREKLLAHIQICDSYVKKKKAPRAVLDKTICRWCNYQETCGREK